MTVSNNPYYTGEVLSRSRIDNFIPQVWIGDIRYYRDSNFFMSSLTKAMNVVGKKGDTYKIPLVGRAGVNDRIPGQPVELQARTPGQYQVTVDQDKETSFGIDDIVMVQSQYDTMKIYTKEAGYAMARDLDNALLALRAAIPTTQQLYRTTGTGAGTAAGTPAALDEGILVAALLQMMEANVPVNECAWVFSPKQVMDLIVLDIIKSKDYDTGNLTVGQFNSGRMGTLWNLPVYVSTQITNNTLDGYIPREGASGLPTPGVIGSPYLPTQDSVVGSGLPRGQTGSEVANPFQTGMLVHPEWACLLKQKNISVTKSFENLLQMDALVTRHIYGSKLYRTDHSVLIHSQGT